MSLKPGNRLGPYEIASSLGAGGMGEVYKARDTRLDRTVAIKVLPEAMASDPHFRERFDREARAISQLDHPHICALYDVGEQDGTSYLVMQYLEGETLADRLVRGALPIDQALTIAAEIADALDKAHTAGIVHRDLKPGNVMLTKAGAKLLDFGLAKATTPAVAGTAHSMLPTTPAAGLTVQGTILGTFQYMAPEQLEGREADARSDIFALGAVLYEMATGKKAFEGKTHAGLMGAILEREPTPMRTLRPAFPPQSEWVVSRCLAKDPDERWQHARDLLHELRRLRNRTGQEEPTVGAERGSRHAWLKVAAVVILAGIAGWVARTFTSRASAPREALAFTVAPLEGTQVTGGPAAPQAVVSPDGTRVVFSAFDASGIPRLYLRRLDSLEPQLLAGTDEGQLPFWSPDGRFVAFFTSDRKLKKVAIAGGPPFVVCDALGGDNWGGGAWNADGVIIFSSGIDRPLYKVSATGGTPAPVTAIDRTRRERAHLWPSFLPGGRRFLYLIQVAAGAGGGIHVGSLDSAEKTKILDTRVRAAFAPPQHLLFVLDGTLMAQSLDAGITRLTGEPVPIAERVAYNPELGLGRATFALSTTGVLVYRAGGVGGNPVTELRWFDRNGNQVGTVGEPTQVRAFDLSPDGTRVVASRYDARARQWDIFVDAGRPGGDVRLSFTPTDEDLPLWSPDGARVAFLSDKRAGIDDLYVTPATGAASDEVLLESPVDKRSYDWSSDGRRFVFGFDDPKTGADIAWLSVDGDRRPQPLIQTPAAESWAALAPDGRWVAYTSDELGPSQVFVQPVPPTGAKWQVSTTGARFPRWRRDGRELFYLAADSTLMAVEVQPGPSFATGTARPLFRVNVSGFNRDYAVTANGQRFLVNTPVEQTGAAVTVVVNWPERLNK